ncbi:putative Negative regulator of mitosis [Glarea lozoyensis 74030]|uniref:Putative Negative regulator of mitosis n=1 Tax=Glarea lozoyensis (strain ATCC 74030 / MF5533) TaxID=1104152 RepID=H0EFQ0_GLAL7|nr:putative Negative regulator of mitosis [Glarea lozoyensis 74030]
MPGTATGATTPVMNNQATFRESFGGAPGAKGGAKQADGAKEKTVDFVSALDTEWNGSTVTRRKSRRVSSMLARADLSANHERSAFTELATDERHGNSIVICILDSDEQKLVVLTLHRKIHTSVNHENSIRGKKREKDVNVLNLAPVVRASDVLDACRLDDGQISRILVLTKTPDGYGELSLQAPWSSLMKIPLPARGHELFAVFEIRNRMAMLILLTTRASFINFRSDWKLKIPMYAKS